MAAKDVEAGRAHVLLSIRDKMTQGLKLAEKRFQQFGRYAATTGAVMSAGAVGGLLWPVKLSASMEQASVAMEVFLGSAKAAEQLLGDIELMAAKTPFRFDELKDAANLLLGFGATGNQILPMLRLLGDASRGNSESFAHLALAFGQTMAKGRLMGQEVLQMTEQGFNPLYWLNQKTGVAMAELTKQMEDGQISFAMLVEAFQYATGPMGKFNGMMDKQSQTLVGLTSSFLDFFSMLSRAVGDTLVPLFKDVLISANKMTVGFLAIIKANSGLVGIVAKAILAVGLLGGAFTLLGVASMAFSFVVGLMASGMAFLVGVFTTIFSPLGILIGLLGAAGVAAIAYRQAIMETFRGLLIWAQPVIDAFYRIFGAASGAVQGIVDALSKGNIQLAGQIAIGALLTMFWQAAAEIPAVGLVLATGFGQALLAGKWDLMAAIAMENVKLAIVKGWNAIANVWSAMLTGLGVIWDTAVYGFRTGWHTASTAIATGMLWMVGQISSGITVLQNLWDELVTGAKIAATVITELFGGDMKAAEIAGKAMLAELDKRMAARTAGTSNANEGMLQALREDAAQTQRQIDQDLKASMTGRVASEQNAVAQRKQAESSIEQRIAALNAQATQAATDAGVTSAAEAASKAQGELQKLVTEAAKKAQTNIENASNRVVPGLAGTGGLPKVESRGTFTAAAALAFGNRSDTDQEIARNTGASARWLRIIADKKAAFS